MSNINLKISPVAIEERKNLDLSSGNTVRVWQKIQEKGKTRLQAFEGLIIARKHGVEPGATFTVRKISKGIGVEKIFPLYSPAIDRIEIIKRTKVRRSKLYYIREKAVREIRRRMKQMSEVALSKAEKKEQNQTTLTPEKLQLETEVINEIKENNQEFSGGEENSGELEEPDIEGESTIVNHQQDSEIIEKSIESEVATEKESVDN